mmetsp:Transcript_65792/g.154888  ORF Transcript_65792/g.154888 Transcript_65792/m.154888 type:complete len:269 (-) Transcript_65792:476-1282(-)
MDARCKPEKSDAMPWRNLYLFQLRSRICLTATNDDQNNRRLQLDQFPEDVNDTPASRHLNDHGHVRRRQEGRMKRCIHVVQEPLLPLTSVQRSERVQRVLELWHNRNAAHSDVFLWNSVCGKLEFSDFPRHKVMVCWLLVPPSVHIHVSDNGHLWHLETMPPAKRGNELRGKKMCVHHHIGFHLTHKLHEIHEEALCYASLQSIAAGEGVVHVVGPVEKEAHKHSTQISAESFAANESKVPVFVEVDQGTVRIRRLHEIHDTNFNGLI